MVWNRLNLLPTGSSEAIIYRATRTRHGITFEATNLSRVWVERLDDNQIISRAVELSSIIALDTRQDITEFFKMLQSEMHSPTRLECNGTLELDYTIHLDENNKLEWYFRCAELPAEEARAFLGSVVHELFEVISDLNVELVAEKNKSKQFRYHIRNLTRLCAKEVPYNPHRFQESYQEVINNQRDVQDTLGSSDPIISSDGIPSSPPRGNDALPEEEEKWHNGISISKRFLAEQLQLKKGDQNYSDADVTLTAAAAANHALNTKSSIPASEPSPDASTSAAATAASQAFSQALSQFSQDQHPQNESAEQLRLKLHKQRVNSKKRRRF